MNSSVRILILLGLAAAGFSGQAPQTSGPSAEERQCLDEALPLLQKHALSDAERRLSDCRSQHPESAILNNVLGIVYEQEGRKADAIRAFEKALALLPSFTAAQIHLGALYAGAGNCDAGKRLLNAAAASTSDSGALVASGIGLAQCHDLAGAIQVLEKALQSNPASVSAAYNLSLAYYQNNDLQKSLQVLNTLPESQQASDPDVLFLKGKARQGMRRKSPPADHADDREIAAMLSRSCRIRPQEDYCAQAALELIRQEQFGEAAGLLEDALRDTPPSVSMLSALGLARFRLGRYSAAIDAYSKAIDMGPSLEAPREGLGFLLYMTGDLNRARSVVEAGIRPSGSPFYLLYLRALILYRQSPVLRGEALASVSAAIKENPGFAPAYFLRGKILSDENDLSSALQNFQSAVKIDPRYSLPYYRMALTYSAMGRASDAAEAARQFSLRGSLREDDVLASQATERLASDPK
jgi:tetratricopeptide (TPR) repeat protein